MKVNVKNSSIVGSPMIEGDENIVTIGETASIDWTKLLQAVDDTLKRLPENSEEYKATEKLRPAVENKNKPWIMQLVSDHTGSFLSGLFSSAAASYLVEFIRTLT